ncbi:Inositol oxygenase 1 [Datura stramonium]|uniref:Inositol oxygenase n=1 Tax=Datura stramonium TaxID=4076 RepID=A0ABS8RQY4_DATST|nr:Inositol oxygenase 1 [Datura stramonium]
MLLVRGAEVENKKATSDVEELFLHGGFVVPNDVSDDGCCPWQQCILATHSVVDDSDPDLDEPQIEHLLQTAEAIRKDYPNEDWLHLTGLIHDLGKVLLLPSFGGLPQWAVVGDTFPLGCAFDESIVLHEQLKENPDNNNPAYNTKYGVYSEGCGLDNVAKKNKTTLPSAALFIVRYHSFYRKQSIIQLLCTSQGICCLMNGEDHENLKWLHIFNKYDLYSKSKVRIDVEKVKPYYMSLIEKNVQQGCLIPVLQIDALRLRNGSMRRRNVPRYNVGWFRLKEAGRVHEFGFKVGAEVENKKAVDVEELFLHGGFICPKDVSNDGLLCRAMHLATHSG